MHWIQVIKTKQIRCHLHFITAKKLYWWALYNRTSFLLKEILLQNMTGRKLATLTFHITIIKSFVSDHSIICVCTRNPKTRVVYRLTGWHQEYGLLPAYTYFFLQINFVFTISWNTYTCTLKSLHCEKHLFIIFK